MPAHALVRTVRRRYCSREPGGKVAMIMDPVVAAFVCAWALIGVAFAWWLVTELMFRRYRTHMKLNKSTSNDARKRMINAEIAALEHSTR
jgi:hypothetical protein